ncbi:MAG TPA: hypothetical protein VN648_28225 [Candidatus Methylomirabilis sp.]|nr:hypothetical protein [Candidatus Methylomirabilis sp.]
MTNYARMYRFGITPWERYRTGWWISLSRSDRPMIPGGAPGV